MEPEQLFHKEVKQLEKEFRGTMMANTDNLVDQKTARRLALSARPVLRRVRANFAMKHQQQIAWLQQEKEEAQQAAKQNTQDLQQQVSKQYKQKIQNLEGEIVELKASLRMYNKKNNRKSRAIGFGYGMTESEQHQGFFTR